MDLRTGLSTEAGLRRVIRSFWGKQAHTWCVSQDDDPADAPEMKWLKDRFQAMGGGVPQRRRKAEPLQAPPLSAFDAQLKSSGERELSTTMAFVRILTAMLRDKTIGKRVVPIVADEARTFGMEGMFRQYGIYSHIGQL